MVNTLGYVTIYTSLKLFGAGVRRTNNQWALQSGTAEQ
jgi:hypothetical protein